MNQSDTSISAIIPTYNSKRYLKPAIESVLNQTLIPTEIFIVDDGSADDTIAIARSYASFGVQVLQRIHQGIGATRNAGIKHAKGAYLAFLDADDLWDPKKLETQIAVLKEKPHIQGVFGKIQQFISPDLLDDEKKNYHCPNAPQNGYHAGCLLMSRKAFLKIGLFSENLKAAEFIEWYIRAKQQGIIFEMVNTVLMYRRIHGNNTVLSDPSQINSEYLKIIRMKLKNFEI